MAAIILIADLALDLLSSASPRIFELEKGGLKGLVGSDIATSL